MDSVLQFATADGSVLAENDEYHDMDSQIVFVAPSAGTYLIRLFGFPATPTSTIGFAGGEDFVYRLTVTAGPFVEHAFPMAVPAPPQGSGESPGDGVAAVELRGWNIPDSARSCKCAAAPPGETVTVFHPDVAGFATVRSEPHATEIDREPNGREAPQPIQVPVTISGRIDEARDVDLFRFSATKGDKLTFRVESRALGFPLDPALRLMDATGKTLAEVDDSGGGRDAELAFTAPADGEYRLMIRDLHGHGGPRYVYRLIAVPARPEFSLRVAADSFAVTPGKPVEIPVTINRLNGHAAEIEIGVEGLPEGVTATAAKSAGSGDSAKSVKITLNASKPLVAGSFRIVGRTTGDTPGSATALATLANPNTTTQDLWITVLKMP
jgi:hypothetical protein